MPSIVFFIPNLVCAGAENVCISLYKEMSKNIRVIIIIQEWEGDLLNCVRKEDLYCLGTRRTLPSIIRLRKLLKILKPTSALAFMNTPSVILGLASVGLDGMNTFGSVHNLIGNEVSSAKKSIKGFLRVFLYPVGFSLLNGIIFVSNSCRETFINNISLYRSVSLDVIYNPINFPSISDNTLGSEGDVGSVFRVLAVGRLVPVKNFGELIFAIDLISKKGMSVELTIVGEGIMKEEFRDLIKSLGLQEQVKLEGYKEFPFENSQCFNLFCLPSLNEGFGNVLVEAMSVGLPVITTKNGGGEEAVGDAGCILSGVSRYHIAGAIEDLYHGPEVLADMKARGFDRANFFSSGDPVCSYLEVLL